MAGGCKNKDNGCRNRANLDLQTGLCPSCLNSKNNPTPAYLASFPPAAMTAATNVNMDTVNKVAEQCNKGEEVDPRECMLAMFGMMASLHSQNSEMKVKVDAVETLAKSNERKIEELEKKVGRKDECAIPLSITIQNLPVSTSISDEENVKKVIAEVGAQGVDPETDVVKVERRGYKPANSQQAEKLGTVMVELSSTDVKGKVMRSKKILESKPNELAKLKIRNMKSVGEMNQDYFNRQMLKMIPGGEKFYIGANGALRPQQGQPRQGLASGSLRPSSYASAALPTVPRPLGPVQRLHQQQQQSGLAPLPGLHPPATGFFSTPPPPSTQGDNLPNFFAR